MVAMVLEISGEWRHKVLQANLNRNLPQRWIGRIEKEDDALMRWPPRSPDLTPCDDFFWVFDKDTVFVPPFPADLQDLRNRFTAAVARVDRDMLTRVKRDGLSHTCLPYYQRWTYRASVKYIK
jgi:hypothetical protein